jgi:hypothetical protein
MLYTPVSAQLSIADFTADLTSMVVDDLFYKKKQDVRGMKSLQHMFFFFCEVLGALKERKPEHKDFYTEVVLSGKSALLFKSYSKVLNARLAHAATKKDTAALFEWLTNMQKTAAQTYEKHQLGLIYISGTRPSSSALKYKDCESTAFEPIPL